MLRVQDAAYAMARRDGFDNVTVEAVAAAADVSPSTVYRYFGTKEGIFVWDELELPAVDIFAEELATKPPLQAVLGAFHRTAELGFHVSEEEMRRRIRFLYEQPALGEALGATARQYQTELAAMIGDEEAVGSQVIAATAIAAMLAVVEAWALSDRSLLEITDEAIEALGGG